jgi:G3E family GTPase
MGSVTEVVLITGFLGSGKTTLLNRLIDHAPRQRKLMVLVNEFGDIGIDGQLVERGPDVELVEINRGSIFCVCVKRDFIRTLARVAQEIQPDLLVIEATGIANPADLRRDLALPCFGGRFAFSGQICVLDAENFLDTYGTFVSIEKQLATSTLFVVNKVEMVAAPVLEQIRQIVATHRPAPEIVATSYCRVPLERISLLFSAAAPQSRAATSLPTAEQIDAAIAELCGAATDNLSPPDRLAATVIVWRGRTRDEFDSALAALPPGIVRAKGFILIGGRPVLFSRVLQSHALQPWEGEAPAPTLVNQMVFIGSPEAVQHLESACRQPRSLLRCASAVMIPLQPPIQGRQGVGGAS